VDSIPTQTGNHAFTYYVTAVSNTDGNLLESAPSNELSLTSFGAPGSPVITVPAAASPAPVTGTTAVLSVTATSVADPDEIVYSWATVGTPPASVQFSPNIDDPNGTWTATFMQAGTYVLQATAEDDLSNLASTSDVTVVVQQTATSINITPATANVPLSTGTQTSTQQFSGQILDQFGNTMAGTIAWSNSGSGSISSTGLYTAPTSGTTDTITATDGALSANATATFGASGGSGVTAVGIDQSEIDLSWTAVPSAICYEVYRDTQPNFDPSEANMIADSLSSPSFADFNVEGGPTYYYEVLATTPTTTVLLGAAQSAPGAPITSQPTISSLQAVGVNDLEILLHWSGNSASLAQPAEIQERTDDGTNWSYVGYAAPGESYYLVRGCGPGGSQFMQEGQSYVFRLLTPLAAGELIYPVTATAQVRIPSVAWDLGQDMVVVCAPYHWSLSQLLAGASLNTTGSGDVVAGLTADNSVAMIWADLVNIGYDAYLVPDPNDGGSFSPGATGSAADHVFGDGERLESTINTDGSGRISDEIQHQASIWGTALIPGSGLDVGLLGYSWGGGMTDNISNYLWSSVETPLSMSVVYAGTIDAVQYGTSSPLADSPATIWGGTGFNYYEDYGDFPWYHQPHGALLPGSNVTNSGPYSLTHSSIGIDLPVLVMAELDLYGVFGSLSN
jgi:hypothetical protein